MRKRVVLTSIYGDTHAMNTRERYNAIMTRQEVDRTLKWEQSYWGATLRRWYQEGLPRIHGIPDSIKGAITARAESLGVPPENHPASDPHNYFDMDPFMLKSGGYIPHLAHSVPPDISFDNFNYYRQKLNNIILQNSLAADMA
jgi:hypothetical protein